MKVIYEYRCSQGHIFERMFEMGHAPSAVSCHPLHPEYPPEWTQQYALAHRQLSRGNFAAFKGSYLSEVRGG